MPIQQSQVYELMRRWIKFPNATICKHAVVLDLLDLLERSGYSISTDLVKSVVESDDEKSLPYLNSEIKFHRIAELLL